MFYESQEVTDPQQLRNDDIVMLFMGATGTGKSHIIDTLTGKPGRLSRDSLECFTKKITGHRIQNHHKYGSRLVCVDTPGLDDTHLSDIEILEMISEWLVCIHSRRISLAGIFYLYRITDNRMGGTPLRNLRIFNELCGDKARHAVLVTTMWDKLPNQTEGENREASLKKNYWNGMVQHGAFVDRFENTSRSAWDVVGTMVVRFRKNADGIPLLLQEELIIHKKRLEETKAARAVHRGLQDHLARRQEAVLLLIDALKYQRDENIHLQLFKLQRDIEKIVREVDRLHISFGRRLVQFIYKPQMLLLAPTIAPDINSGFSKVYNSNSRRTLEPLAIQPRECGDPPLGPGARESWILVQGITCVSENEWLMERAEDKIPRPLEEEIETNKLAAPKHVSCEPETETPNATFKAQRSSNLVGMSCFTSPKDEVESEHQSKGEHSLPAEEEAWVDDERSGRKKACKPTKGKSRGTSRRARSKSARRNANLNGQLEEVSTFLSRIETTAQVQLNFGPVTYNYGSCQSGVAGAATAAVHPF